MGLSYYTDSYFETFTSTLYFKYFDVGSLQSQLYEALRFTLRGNLTGLAIATASLRSTRGTTETNQWLTVNSGMQSLVHCSSKVVFALVLK